MKHGFIKVACASPKVTVANPMKNGDAIAEYMHKAHEAAANICAFPELSITGCTCGDLFRSEILLNAAKAQLLRLKEESKGLYPVFIAGLPLQLDFKLYNCAAVIHDGEILGIVPKTCLTARDRRWFASPEETCADGLYTSISLDSEEVIFAPDTVFCHPELEAYRFAVEIGEDFFAPGFAGCAPLIINPAASMETVGSAEYRRMMVKAETARMHCACVHVNAGPSESTQDGVYSGHDILCEKGRILAETCPLEEGRLLVSEIDVNYLAAERRKDSLCPAGDFSACEPFMQEIRETALTRFISPAPFTPDNPAEMDARMESILNIQAHALKKRIEITYAKSIVVGISGGLDSCLALLVMARAMDLLGRDRKDILAVSMPCFGTTSRTRSNAQILCEELGVTFREISIAESVRRHFADIGHDESVRDVTYENSQARERTQVIMDIANQVNGFVVGTGDLSELALGWATYNGDHMSMYGVNADVPKTLVRHVVRYAAGVSHPALKAVLLDILDTPVSPELLPAQEDGTINQKTEDIVGPYELHDFFLYYTVRRGYAPEKILRLALAAFDGQYDEAVIRKWLSTFTRRFFIQQFKRSCLPDGPKVGSVGLSPRGDWCMPSDASGEAWMENLR